MKIILASASPRRAELLKLLNIKFETKPSNIDEDRFFDLCPKDLVQKLSFEKAKSILNKNDKNVAIIGSDTIVCINDRILGKPKDKEDAFRMLSMLNGNKHTVFTGLCILGFINGNYFEEVLYSYANVYFGKYSDKQLISYINTSEYMDKAGSYAIQGKGSFLVEKIEGDFYSIVGLPIQKLYFLLEKYKLINF